MAVVAEVVGGGAVRGFVSPLRILARSFRLSRDKWKAKSVQMTEDVKRLKVSVYDVQQSRATWRQRAEAAESELAALPARTATPTEAPPKKSARAAS